MECHRESYTTVQRLAIIDTTVARYGFYNYMGSDPITGIGQFFLFGWSGFRLSRESKSFFSFRGYRGKCDLGRVLLFLLLDQLRQHGV